MADLSNFFDENFDDSAVKASTGIPEAVPPGTYTLTVDRSEVNNTKANDGVKLDVHYVVASGPHEGQRIFTSFNVRNKNAQAQTIAIGEFKALCLAVGVPYEIAKTDTETLHHIPFDAVIGYDKPSVNSVTKELYAPKNRVKKYIPAGQDAPATAAAAAPMAAATMAQARPTPKAGTPWGKDAPF